MIDGPLEYPCVHRLSPGISLCTPIVSWNIPVYTECPLEYPCVLKHITVGLHHYSTASLMQYSTFFSDCSKTIQYCMCYLLEQTQKYGRVRLINWNPTLPLFLLLDLQS